MTTIGHELPKSIRVQVIDQANRLPCELDPCLVEQVLFNLSLNARDAMPDGGELRVSIECVDVDSSMDRQELLLPGTYAKINVTDSGIGMAPEILNRIFEPFFHDERVDGRYGIGVGHGP